MQYFIEDLNGADLETRFYTFSYYNAKNFIK